MLYAIFVLPMFDLALLFPFANDTYMPKSNKKLTEAIIDLNNLWNQSHNGEDSLA
jgi:hypothetical protein